MTIILPDPITGTNATLTLIEGQSQRQVTAHVTLLPSAKVITFQGITEVPPSNTAPKPARLYKKKFTGKRVQLPAEIRIRLEQMPHAEMLDYCARTNIKPAYISQLLREPNRGLTSGLLQRILSGFDQPAAPVQQPLEPLHDLGS